MGSIRVRLNPKPRHCASLKSRTNSSTADPIISLDSASSRRSTDKTPEKEYSTAAADVTLLVARNRCDHRENRKRLKKENCVYKQREMKESSRPPLVNCDKNRADSSETPRKAKGVERCDFADDQMSSTNSRTSTSGDGCLLNVVLVGMTSYTCQECGRQLSPPSDAKRGQVATHTVEKPTVCKDCDPRKCNVDDHQQTLQLESKSCERFAADSCNLVSYQDIN